MPLLPLQSGTVPSPRPACAPSLRLIASRGSSRVCRSPSTSAGSSAQSKVVTACSPLPAEPACSLPAASVLGSTSGLGTPAPQQLQRQAHDGKATARTGYGPGWLTSQICAARDVAELAACVQAANELNSIHVAAAIVRLAKVAQSEDSASAHDPSSSASRQQPGASSSGSDAGHVGHATSARQPAHNRRRGRRAAPAGSAAGSGSSSTDGTAADAAQALAQRLGGMYLEYSAQGLYSTARQHSNITWALSKLGFAPPAGLVQQAISQMLESGQRRLKTSNAQEVANLAYGLAQLGVVWPDVWVAIAAAAQQHLTAFKPQELSNLAWALATTHQKAQQQHVGQAERAQAERTQAERTQAERAQAERRQAERVQAQRQDSQHQGGAEVRKLAQAQQVQQMQQMQQQVQHAQQQQAQQQLAQTGERRPSLQQVCRELLHDLARQAALDVPRFAPSELSTLLWALAKAGVQWRPLLTATDSHLTALSFLELKDRASSNSTCNSAASGRLCPPLSEFSCQELCNVLGAYARLRHRHNGLMVKAADIFTGWAEADALPSQSIANAVWAMARLQQLPPQESAAVGADATAQRQQQLVAVQEQHSAVLLRFTHAMAAAAARSTQRFNAQEISNALWGLLKLQESLGDGAASDAEHELLLSAQLLGAEVAEPHGLDSAPDAALDGVQQAARIAAAGFASHEGGSAAEAAGSSQQQQQQQQQQQGRRPREQRQGSSWESAPAHPTGGQPGAILQANLVRLANAARWRAGSMEPAALAQLSWACWRLAGPDADHLVLAVSGAALPRLAQFKAQELTTLVHSLARQKQVYLDARLMRAAGDAAVALLQARGGGGGGGGARAFTPAGLANLVWAFAVRGQRHDALARAIATTARQRIRHFGHQELANLLWGLYRLGHHDKALLDAAAECIIARGEACTSHSGSGSSVGGSSERDSSGEIDAAAAAAAAAEAQPSRAAGMAAAVQAWCFARCKYNMPRLYDALGASILQHLACVPPYNLAQLLWAFASQGCRHRPLLAAAARLVTTRLLRFEAVRSRRRAGSLASGSSNSIGSVSLLDYDYADLSSMQEAQREQQPLQQSDLSTKGSGPAMLQSAQTQQQGVAEGDGREPHFDSQGVANTLWAFSKAGHRCPQLMQRIGDELAGSYTLATVAGASSTPASTTASDGATHRHPDSAQTLSRQGHFAAPPSLGVSGLLDADMSHATTAGSTNGLNSEASSAARASHADESAGAAYSEVVEFSSSRADLQCSLPGDLFDASVPLLGPAPSPPCDDPAEQAQAPESDTGAGGHCSDESAASQAMSAGPIFGSLAYSLGEPALDPRLNPEINMEAMHPADLCLIAWAFAKLRFPHPALFSALLRAALRDAPRYNLKGWSQLVWAYSTLGLPEEELLMSRLQQLQLQQERQQSEAQASGQQHQHQQRRGFQQGQGSGQGFVRGKVMGRHRGRAGAQRPRRQWATAAGRRDGGEGGGSSSSGSSDGARPNRRHGLWSRSTDMNGSGSGRSNAGGGNSSLGGGSSNAGSGGRDRERDAHGSLTQGPEAGAGAAITDPLSSCSCLVQPGVGGVHFAQARSALAPVGAEPGHTAAAAAANSEGLTVLSEGAGRLQSLRVASPALLVPPVARDWLREASAFSSSIGSSGPSSSGSSGSSSSARQAAQPGASALAAVQASLADAEGDAYGDAEADAMLAMQQHAVLRPGLPGRAGSGNGSSRQSRRAVQTWAQRPQATTSAAEHRLHVSQSSAELLPRPNRPPPTHTGRAELGVVIQHTAAAAAAATAAAAVVGHAWDEGTLQAVPASVIVMAGIAPQAL